MNKVKTLVELNELMKKVYPNHRLRWCYGQACACMGCVNNSSPIANLISQNEWNSWMEHQNTILRIQKTKKELMGELKSKDEQGRKKLFDYWNSGNEGPPLPFLDWKECYEYMIDVIKTPYIYNSELE